MHVVKEFFWAVFEKLSPARRVLLLLALILLVIPHAAIDIPGEGGKVQAIEFDLHFWAALLLLLLLMLEIADRVVMKRDLQIAREIQTWLLPGAPPQIPGLSIAYATRPANTVAGDYYDVFPRPGSTQRRQPRCARRGRCRRQEHSRSHADGHISGQPQNAFHRAGRAARTRFQHEPLRLHQQPGRIAFHHRVSGGIRPVRRTVDYINAGHNNPILRRASGQIERLDVGGLPFGILPDAKYESATVTLAPGDWLIIFTDGLVEAENARQEEYGEARLLSAIEAGKSEEPAEMLKRLMAEVDLFVGKRHSTTTSPACC